jgi:hypothetical protein
MNSNSMPGEVRRVRSAPLHTEKQNGNHQDGPIQDNTMNESTSAADRPADVFPDFAVSLEETARRVKMLQQYVREQMQEGEDYGVIPGSTKPTLFKPGAEKLNSVFGLAPMVEITNRVEDWDKGFVSYEVKVTLVNKRTQQVEAEGIGSCNSKERRYARQDAPSIANTILKMSKKRALIDATLSATRASGLFTQDLEDMDDSGNRNWSGSSNRSAAQPQNRPAPHPNIEEAEQTSAHTAARGGWSGGDNNLTDAQHRAIIAIAGRVFGRPAAAEDFGELTDKPLEELTKGEASALIDRLRFKLAEKQGGGASNSSHNGRDNFNRAAASTNGSHNNR